MAFNLGNFAVKEIIYGVAQDFNDNLLYTLDQLTSASIEVSSDPTDITDKNGNIIKSIYQSKTATFTAQSALLSPVLMNAQSGSTLQEAGASPDTIDMPYIGVFVAGAKVDVTEAKEGTIHVMGLFNNGANGKVLTQSTTDNTPTYAKGVFYYYEDGAKKYIQLPPAAEGAATKYLVKFTYAEDAGYKLQNTATAFPDTVRLTLYAAIVDPCEDKYRAAYIVIPSFQPSPAVTINLDSETTETEYTGSVMIDYCQSTDKVLYYVYFPDKDAVTTVESGVEG